MRFKYSLNERSLIVLGFVLSLCIHSVGFGFGFLMARGGEQVGHEREPITIEIASPAKVPEEVEPLKEEEPPPPPEEPPEEVREKQLEQPVAAPLPPPPPPPKPKKMQMLAERKGKTPKVSPLIAKAYDTSDQEGVAVPKVEEAKKLEGTPPAVIPQPIMGTPLGRGTGAEEDAQGTIKELAYGGNGGPSFKEMVKPEYPELARRMGKEGYVLLKVLVDTRGKAVRVEVVQGAGRAFDESAVAAVKRSTFYPARENGVPIPCYVKIPIRFQLVQR